MKEQINKIIEEHKKMVEELQENGIDTIEEIANVISKTIRKGGTLYICGNGGSAADAQHIAGEFIGRFLINRKALPAVALSTDTSVLTCVANDYDFEDIFARQVEALMKKQDCLWAFSTSGKSPNILKAAKLAKKIGAKIIAFTGKKNTPLEKISDVCLSAEAQYTYASQEIHQIAYHIICGLVEKQFS
ncbi:MAG: SIS domain-containing protein [Phycisphaerales bacterium]